MYRFLFITNGHLILFVIRENSYFYEYHGKWRNKTCIEVCVVTRRNFVHLILDIMYILYIAAYINLPISKCIDEKCKYYIKIRKSYYTSCKESSLWSLYFVT